MILAQKCNFCQQTKLCQKDTFKNPLKFSNFVIGIAPNICCGTSQIKGLLYRLSLGKFMCLALMSSGFGNAERGGEIWCSRDLYIIVRLRLQKTVKSRK